MIDRVSFPGQPAPPTPAAPTATHPGLLDHLRAAAADWVERGATLPALRSLEAAEVLPGLILDELVGRLGSLEDAFAWLGQERVVASRNHHRISRRLREPVRALEQALGAFSGGAAPPIRTGASRHDGDLG